MKLVVDTNILFTFFWKTSVFRKISFHQELNLVSPEFALEEINKHKEDIKRRAKISELEFKELRKELALRVEFIPLSKYSSYFNKVLHLTKEVIKGQQGEFLEDIDFLALALQNKCPLWTHDTLLKEQSFVTIFGTKEIIQLLDKDDKE